MTNEQKRLPLNGIKVVDLSTVVAAPTAAELLCAFGADVIKVESMKGDDQRFIGDYLKTPYRDDCNPIYTVQNANKRHISINLKSPEGKEAMMKLLEDADVFLVNVRTQGLKRLGLDYETLSEKFPRLIYAHFSGYGPKGPNKDDPGFDSTVFWLRGGQMGDWCPEDAEYIFNPTYAFGDTVTASSFFSAILLALMGREQYGVGTKVETSLYASAIWCNGQGVVQTQFDKKVLNPAPDERIDLLNEYYRCGDGKWFAINKLNTWQTDFPIYANTLEAAQEFIDDPRCATEEEFLASGVAKEVRKLFVEAFRKKPAVEWKKAFAAVGIPCDVAVNARDVCTDEQAIVNGYLEEVTYQDGTKVMMPTPPMYLSNYDRKPITPVGPMGDCTDEILESIGYGAEKISKLKEEGIVK